LFWTLAWAALKCFELPRQYGSIFSEEDPGYAPDLVRILKQYPIFIEKIPICSPSSKIDSALTLPK
jgi:hypothetical protein